jgi:hypothetical protein
MNYFKKFFPPILVLTAICFNLYTLFPELSIQIDLNDNIFHYGLVNRMNIVWNESDCPFSLKCLPNLLDHNVPEWAQGYSLPFFYQHLPHLFIVATYRIFKPLFSILHSPFSIYNHFHLLQYLLLSFFPLIMYVSCRLFGLTRLTSALAALLSTQISTDGLYGLDVSSFTWRGFGVFSQLVAMIFLPLSLAQIYHTIYIYIKRQRVTFFNLLLSILFLGAAFASHLAFGYIAIISAVLIPLSFTKLSAVEIVRIPLIGNIHWGKTRGRIYRQINKFFRSYLMLFLIYALTFILLSYWFIPLFTHSALHAKSFWDSPWKWDSYGLRFVIYQFLNGALLDFDRFPLFTLLTLTGFFVCAYRFEKKYRFFTLLFPLWFVLYMGRPALGPLLKFLPMSAETHLHRFINGLHVASLFLAPIGLTWLVRLVPRLFSRSIQKYASPLIQIILITLISLPIYYQTYRYLNYNKILIRAGNDEFSRDSSDFKALTDKLKSLPPGRLYVGKTGNWGRNQKAGPTPLYMALNIQGFETIGFLPETWSLNSDTEQFFQDTKLEHYNLYNIRYAITPDWFKVDFFKFLGQFGKYFLYEVPTTGYFDLVQSHQTVILDKKDIINPVHYWQFTDLVKEKEHPTLLVQGSNTRSFVNNEVKFLDTVNYQKGGSVYNLFANPPFISILSTPSGQIKDEKNAFQNYEARILVPDPCDNCYGLFKMTYHPDWQIFVDGKRQDKVMLFPAFIGFPITPGEHQVKAIYQPYPSKIPLFFLGILSLFSIPFLKKFFNLKSSFQF